MKREELSSLGLGEELIGRVMALHGADIERHKNEASRLRSRLAEAEERLGALEGAQGEAESWRERFEILEAETARREYRRAAESAAGALRFSSKGARQAFLAALDERGSFRWRERNSQRRSIRCSWRGIGTEIRGRLKSCARRRALSLPPRGRDSPCQTGTRRLTTRCGCCCKKTDLPQGRSRMTKGERR